MCCNQKFFICKHCGNMVGIIENKGVPLVCCGEPMAELVANTVEAATEKHIPVVEKTNSGITVSVGSVAHPMEEQHNIGFVYVATTKGGQRKCLKPGEAPKVSFSFVDDEPVAVFAYCNLHGLWKADV